MPITPEQIGDTLRTVFPHGHPMFTRLLARIAELHSNKNKDYAGGGNPLGNFYRVAAILSLYPGLRLNSPAVLAAVYALKQVDAELWLRVQGKAGECEGLESRLMDQAVYALIRICIDAEFASAVRAGQVVEKEESNGSDPAGQE